MRTPIYTSRKLEKQVKKLIKKKQKIDCGILGKWNATLFYVSRKKCWLISNAKTQYNVILTDIKTEDLKSIDVIFKNAFYGQLTYDGIITDFEKLSEIIGKLEFLPTDNDRRMAGFQNHRLYELDWWKHEFGTLKSMPIKDLTNRINTCPIHIGKGRKISDYTSPIKEMFKIMSD